MEKSSSFFSRRSQRTRGGRDAILRMANASLFCSLLAMSLFFSSCGNQTSGQEEVPTEPERTEEQPVNAVVESGLPEGVLANFPEIGQSSQLVIVTTEDFGLTTGQLSTWQKQDGRWTEQWTAVPINIGKAGFAAVGEKREGDGKSPSGLFALSAAFGYTDEVETAMPYLLLNDTHYWMSDPDSANYNQLLNYRPSTPEMEKMRRSDDLYSYGVVVDYNMEPAVPGHGSAIFLHVERGPGKHTLGCVSMEKGRMKDLIEWLEPEARPVVLMGVKGMLGTD